MFAIAALALVAAWIAVPPFGYWADGRIVPITDASGAQALRTAFLPAFQPLSLGGIGSGADPDVETAWATGRSVINQYLTTYPANAAFRRYLRAGDSSQLAALGIDRIIARPWFSPAPGIAPDPHTNQRADAVRFPNAIARTATTINPIPLFSLNGIPSIGALDRDLGTNGVFFGDLHSPDIPSVIAFQSPGITADPRRGWTSAELASSMYPQIAQGIGGVATSSNARIALRTLQWTLEYSHGRFAWTQTSPGRHVFACRQLCAVVATTRKRPRWPLDPIGARRFGRLSYRQLSPWWFVINVPPLAQARLIRFNTAYDPHWQMGGAVAQHLRIDAAVNGWIVAADAKPRRLTVMHSVSLIQAVLSAVGLVWTLALFAFAFWSSRARYQIIP